MEDGWGGGGWMGWWGLGGVVGAGWGGGGWVGWVRAALPTTPPPPPPNTLPHPHPPIPPRLTHTPPPPIYPFRSGRRIQNMGWTPDGKLWLSTRGGDVFFGSPATEKFDQVRLGSRGFGILDVG